MKKNTFLVIVISILVLFVTFSFVQASNNDPNGEIQDQVDKLLFEYNKALDLELANGETVVNVDENGEKTKILTGASTEKMRDLWLETLNKINILQARPASEQVNAVAAIKLIESDANVEYLDRDLSPYDRKTELERYQTAEFYYWLSIDTNKIVQIARITSMKVDVNNPSSEAQLEERARAFVVKIAPELDLSKLNPSVGSKNQSHYFFRWEDSSLSIDGKTPVFVQVGLSSKGDLINYVSTFPLLNNQLLAQVLTFNEIYANDGSYWGWKFGPYSVTYNAGYCYIYGWCSPKYFRWTNTVRGSATSNGYWLPNPNTLVNVSAFIPGTDATTLMACYRLFFNGCGTLDVKCISQSEWYDTWVVVSPYNLSNLTKVVLRNNNDGDIANARVAWDEIWVHTP